MVDQNNLGPPRPSRRKILGASALSAAGLLALGDVGMPAWAKTKHAKQASSSSAQDAALLNAAIGLEHEGIAAYQIAAGSGLLSKGVLEVGVLFQSHHKRHRDDLIAAVRRLGAKPVEAKTDAEYAEAIGAASLKSEADVLALALKLERGAASAYLGLIAPLKDEGLEVLVARLGADEAAHVGYLTAATSQALPAQAPMFG